MTTAIACANAGYSVAIIDNSEFSDAKFETDKRTSALTANTLKFFTELGLEFQKSQLGIIDHIYTFESTAKPVLSFDSAESNHIGAVCFNSDLKSILLNKIKQNPLISIHEHATVTNASCDLHFITISAITKNAEKFLFKSKLLLACDGKSSKIATINNIKKYSIPYNQVAFIFNISHTQNHKNIAVESFNPNGPFAILPLANPTQSAIIWTISCESAKILDKYQTQGNEIFTDLLKQNLARMRHIGEFAGIISEVQKYNLAISCLKTQISDRTFFVGDAYNAIHPVAGQSFNMSIKDIQKLRTSLINCKKLGLDFGSHSVLQNIAKSNITHHIAMNLFTDVMVRAFSNKSEILKTLRNFGVIVANNIPQINSILLKNASGL